MAKTHLQLQGIVRGFANHRRIQMLGLLEQDPELSLLDVARRLRMNTKTASEHLRRLAIAGLVMKRSAGRVVRHKLTPRGGDILTFLRKLD